jgi:hypothetical protein
MSPTLARMAQMLPMALMGAIALYFVLGRRRALAQALPVPTAEGVQIPVNAVYVQSGGLLGGKQHNSIRPELTIGREAIRFRALTRKMWSVADIAHVEARSRPGGWKLVFVGRRRSNVLVADILGEANVLAALRALPDSMILTPQAALLRNGSAATGVEGLSLYRGRMW